MKKTILWIIIIGGIVGIGTGVHALWKHHRLARAAELVAARKQRIAENKAAAAAADPNRQPSWTSNALYMAALEGDVDTVKATLDAQPERINEVSGGMRATMLNIAAYKGQKEVVEELLRRGAKVNVQTKGGHTPLYDCILGDGGTVEIAKLLLDAKADFTIPDNKGKTPLQLAVEENKTDIVDLLRQHGANK